MKILLVLVLLALAAIIYRVIKGEATTYMLSRRFGPTLCRMIGHRRRGDAVRKIEGVYHSRCRRCGVRLTKANRDSEWHAEGVAFDDEDEPVEDVASEHEREGGSPVGAIVLLAVGALAIGLMLTPHHVQMRAVPHKSFADLTHG